MRIRAPSYQCGCSNNVSRVIQWIHVSTLSFFPCYESHSYPNRTFHIHHTCRTPTQCSGLQLLTQIIIADITTLKWRGLVSSLVSAPFLINAFVGANISTAVLGHAGWRWGCTSTPSFSLLLLHDGIQSTPEKR